MAVEFMDGIEAGDEELRGAFSRFLGAFDDPGGTLDALRAALPAGGEKPVAVLPFSSQRKKSAAAFSDGTVLIMGAPEFVLGNRFPPIVRSRVQQLTDEGRRVLVLAEAKGTIVQDTLPEVERILGICALSDQIRPAAADTLRYFRQQDVTVKIISGDNPVTVSRIAREAGLEGWESWWTPPPWIPGKHWSEACEKYTVFGRVSPIRKSPGHRAAGARTQCRYDRGRRERHSRPQEGGLLHRHGQRIRCRPSRGTAHAAGQRFQRHAGHRPGRPSGNQQYYPGRQPFPDEDPVQLLPEHSDAVFPRGYPFQPIQMSLVGP